MVITGPMTGLVLSWQSLIPEEMIWGCLRTEVAPRNHIPARAAQSHVVFLFVLTQPQTLSF